MSDPFGYGVSNPQELTVNFTGEVPDPESIYANDPGISQLKANADHSHSLDLGGVNAPWYNLPLYTGITYGPASTRTPTYSRLGSLGFVRGVVNCSGAPASYPCFIGQLPTGFRPISANEQSVGMGFGGVYRIDIQEDGWITLMGSVGGVANPVYVSLGAPMSIYCLD